MSIHFFAVPAAANHAAHANNHVTRVTPRQKSNIYAHFPATRHDIAMKRRLAVYNIKEMREIETRT